MAPPPPLVGGGRGEGWKRHDLAEDLQGEWTLHRTIGAATLAGTAIFSRHDDATLLWHEHGTLHLPDGTSLDAERSYLLRPTPAGFTVLFAETPPRLFHAITLDDALAGEAVHLCGPDTYASRYEFHPDGSFTVRHRVTGPRKDYASLSRYARR